MKPIELYIVDDHSLIIEGLKMSLQNIETLKIVGYATNATDCLNYLKNQSADIVILDINLPDMSGIELCKLIKNINSNIKIIALSTYHQPSYIRQMFQNGAQAYLLKNADPKTIIEAIHAVTNDNTYLSQELDQTLNLINVTEKTKPLLTKREMEILKLIVDGKTNADISKALYISIDTVDTHRKNLYYKLQVKNTAMLIKYAMDYCLI